MEMFAMLKSAGLVETQSWSVVFLAWISKTISGRWGVLHAYTFLTDVNRSLCAFCHYLMPFHQNYMLSKCDLSLTNVWQLRVIMLDFPSFLEWSPWALPNSFRSQTPFHVPSRAFLLHLCAHSKPYKNAWHKGWVLAPERVRNLKVVSTADENISFFFFFFVQRFGVNW